MSENIQENPKRRALGRGLSALISSQPVTVTPAAVELSSKSSGQVSAPTLIPTHNSDEKSAEAEVSYRNISDLQASSVQPRQNFNPQELKELSQSIQAMGILQPILIRPLSKEPGKYEIIAGERRWRAAQLAGLTQVPVIIRLFSDEEASEVAIIENIQRSDLNPMEEAQAYQMLADRFGLNHHQIAEKVGKDRSTISNLLRVLALPSEIQEYVKQGKLSLGHAKALLSIKEPAAQKSLASKIIAEELSVRALESILARNVILKRPSAKRQGKLTPMSDFPEANDRLRQRLGTRTLVHSKADGSGRITIDYFSNSDLDRIVELICE